MNNRVAVSALIIFALLAASLTAIVQSSLIGNNLTTEQSVSTVTVTSTTTQLSSTIITPTTTITSTTMLTSNFVSTTTTTSTITTTVTSTVNVSSTPKTAQIFLISIQGGKAASWSKTRLSILVTRDTTSAESPGLQTDVAVTGAIDQWRRSIAQFTKSNIEYAYLNRLIFTVYIQGVNATALRGNPDIMILFADTLPSLLGETKLFITNTLMIASANSTVMVKGQSTLGLQNILTHELGHAFGLNHASVETDVMYGERETQVVNEEHLCPSTLDLYALALIYSWIPIGNYSPYGATSVTLPQNIGYQNVACVP